MAEEKELKIKFSKNISKDCIVAILKNFGAKKTKKISQVDTYFDFEDYRLLTKDHVLRVREEEDFIQEFTFKTIFYLPSRKRKWYVDEVNLVFPIKENSMLSDVLNRLSIPQINLKKPLGVLEFKDKLSKRGLKEALKIIKKRLIYKKGNVLFMIDEVKNLGLYLEIECEGDDKSPEEVLEELGLLEKGEIVILGYSSEYLKNILGKDVHTEERFKKSPEWNVLDGEKIIYKNLRENGD